MVRACQKSWNSWKFHDFEEFSWILWKTAKIFFYFLLFRVFAPARPACSDVDKPNGIQCFLRSLGALGLTFRRNHHFHGIPWKKQKMQFSTIFHFSIQKLHFRRNRRIAKTSIIPKEFQWFGASDSRKKQNFHKFHKFHEFSRKIKNFMIFYDFHDF